MKAQAFIARMAIRPLSAGIMVRFTIKRLPNGLDTVVEENGSNFSGGERQRLSLARAFLKNRPILILDESTSAVDAVAAADIEEGHLNDRILTLIAITHNVSEEHLRRFDSALEIGV